MTAISLIQPVGEQLVGPLVAMAVSIAGTLTVITLTVRAIFNVFRS